MQQTSQSQKEHTLSLKGRSELTLFGVEDVLEFDETAITCRTTLGELVIEGSSLHIFGFSAEKGELSIQGKISALVYEDKKEGKVGGMRLFRK